MAVANTKSSIITGLDATPATVKDASIQRGHIYESVSFAAVAAADDDGSVYRMHRIPSNAKVSQILVKNDAITGGTAYDMGLYETAENGGAAVDDNLFRDSADLSSARSQWADITGAVAVADLEKRVYELLGLSEDPKKDYDLCFTGDTVGTAAGNIAMLVRYAQ